MTVPALGRVIDFVNELAIEAYVIMLTRVTANIMGVGFLGNVYRNIYYTSHI